jgi:hypothetical protein
MLMNFLSLQLHVPLILQSCPRTYCPRAKVPLHLPTSYPLPTNHLELTKQAHSLSSVVHSHYPYQKANSSFPSQLTKHANTATKNNHLRIQTNAHYFPRFVFADFVSALFVRNRPLTGLLRCLASLWPGSELPYSPSSPPSLAIHLCMCENFSSKVR